jgi:putative ABC transport system permease protein
VIVLSLAAKSLRSRLLTSTLTLASIALGVALLVGIETVRAGMRESFAGTIRGTDLIVGGRGGTVQLLLSSVFGIGSPPASVSRAEYEKWRAHPAVAWTIPYALGDSHHGFRVIGTTDDFYRQYRFRRTGRVTFAAGRAPANASEAAIGSDVARERGYAVGDTLAMTHGLIGTGIMDHEQHPFVVSGVLAPTFTPIDRALYVTLDGVIAMHEDAGAAAGPLAMPGASPPPGTLGPNEPGPDALSAFFVGTRSRMGTLQLQREINTSRDEPLTAAIPGYTLAELWRTIGVAEGGLRVIAAFVVLVSLLGMLVSLYSSLSARRREMAILRAVGAGPRAIVALLVLESGLLSAIGSALGLALVYGLLFAARGPIEARFGLFIPITPPGAVEYGYIAVVVVAGLLIGLVPAVKAYRTSLTDGLSVRA